MVRLAAIAICFATLAPGALAPHGLGAHALAAQTRGTGLDDPPPNFVDHVQPILRENCLACHRGSRAKNGLDLSSVPKILAGGSSGAAVKPGDPDNSLLMRVVEHAQGPFMPPDEEQLGESPRATLRAWIAAGARVDTNDTGAPAATKEAPPLPIVTVGAAPLPPPGLATEPLWWSEVPGPVLAVAASPGAPLAAVGGFGQVSLYALPGGTLEAGKLLGVLPFDEGRPERLSFSATGAVLVAAGGRAGERGLAVGWDVATGARLFALGDEPETALDADITADLSVVVLGGPDRVVRAYDPRTGVLRWEARAHTEWITAIAASPDSTLITSGDRAGGVFVWEALTGREFHRLDPARRGITDLAWRADGARFAVTDESGAVRIFDTESARQVATWNAHTTARRGGAGGALGVAWLADGGLVTVGRDGEVRATDGDGKLRGKPLKLMTESLAVAAGAAYVVVGDGSGSAHVIEPGSESAAHSLAAHPEPRLLREVREAVVEEERARARLAEVRTARAAHDVAAASVAADVEAALSKLDVARAAVEEAERVLQERRGALVAAEALVEERKRDAAAKAAILAESAAAETAAAEAASMQRARMETLEAERAAALARWRNAGGRVHD
jgi:hypothetical protein